MTHEELQQTFDGLSELIREELRGTRSAATPGRD